MVPRIAFALCLFLVSSLAYPVQTNANGAAGGPGLYGNEIIVSDSSPINPLIVDEEVIFDYRNKTVKVEYMIINKSPKAINFSMVFPIADHRNACTNENAKENIKKKNISYGDEIQ